jgi:hypothetical protein
MQNPISEVLEWNVTPGLEADSLVMMDAAISMVKEQFDDPKRADGMSCFASFAEPPSGSSFIVKISVRIDTKDGEPAIRVEALSEFGNAAAMFKAFNEATARYPVS